MAVVLPFPARTLRRWLRLGLGVDMTPDPLPDAAGDQDATPWPESPCRCRRCEQDRAMRGAMMRALD